MRRVLLTRAAALAAAGLIAVGWPSPAAALPALGSWSGTTGPDASATATTTEEVTVTVAISGDHLVIHETQGLNGAPFGSPDADVFTPAVPVDSGWLGLSVLDTHCAPATTCDRGTLTISFSSPVIDPVIHVSGLGSHQDPGGTPAGSAELALAASTPAGAALGEPAPGAANLAVAGGVIRAASPDTAPASCAAGAGCGSVPVTGVVEELVLDVALLNVLEDVIGDGISLLVSAPVWVAPAELPEPAELPKTGVPALALLGLGAAGLLTGGTLLGVRARPSRRGIRRA